VHFYVYSNEYLFNTGALYFIKQDGAARPEWHTLILDQIKVKYEIKITASFRLVIIRSPVPIIYHLL
jgi:hypothetical protein